MSRWEEEFKQNAIHATLKEMRALVSTDFDDVDPEEQSEKRRLLKIILAYEETLSQLDAELVPSETLVVLNRELRSPAIWGQVKAYSTSGVSTHLVAANDHMSKFLIQLSQLLAISKKSATESPIKGLEESLDSFAQAVDLKKTTLESELEKVTLAVLEQKKEIEDLSGSISRKREESERLITAWQEQHSSAQHKRDTDFVADQKARTDSYADWRKEIEADAKSSISDLLGGSAESLDQGQKKFDVKINTYIKDARMKHESILNLYELVAGDSVAGGYKKNADDEKTAANFWRVAAIIFIVLTAIWTGVSYWLTADIGALDQGVFIGRIIKAFSVTGVLLFGAVYSAKQSNDHRENERRTRRFALEVNAIDPFIASLNEEDQKILKIKLSEKLFGQKELGEVSGKGEIIDESALSAVVKGIMDTIKVR
ncbi:MAG: hypothetical protein ACRBBP_09820 [Bdellovibrionales bacterium]